MIASTVLSGRWASHNSPTVLLPIASDASVMPKYRSGSSNAGLLGLPAPDRNRFMRRDSKPRSFFKSAILQSAVVYILYWVLYACPNGTPSKDSPKICYQYHSLKHAVVTKAWPIAEPYYAQYAGPYLSKGEPYYEHVNAILSPAIQRTTSLYSSHVHPVLLKTADGAKSKYSEKIAPFVDPRITRISAEGQKLYDQYLGKHVNTAQAKYDSVLKPHVEYTKKKSGQIYDSALPYASSAYTSLSKSYTSHIHPRLLDLLSWISHYITTRIAPIVRRMYLLHIEPQVNKISYGLFKFNVSTGFASLNKTSAASVEQEASASILSSVTFSTKIESTVIAGETHTIESSTPSIDPRTQAKIDHKVVEDLLTIAEDNIEKEGKAAESALIEKLEDILPALIKKEEILCEDYLTQLESVTVDEVAAIEQKIISFAHSAANKGKSTEEISEELRNYFVRAGKAVHTHAVEVKAHISTVLGNLQTRVQKTTFLIYSQVQTEAQNQRKQPEEKIRYGMDGATKKELKRLDALDDRVKAIEKGLNSKADFLLKEYTKKLSKLVKDTEHKVESLAGGAAKKLHTLHSIGPKKITVGDSSDEFGHGYLPVGAMLGAQAIYQQLSTGVFGAPEPTPELSDRILNSAKSIASDISTNLDQKSIASIASHASSIASEQGQNAASVIATAIAGASTAYSAISEAAPSVDLSKVRASVGVAQEYVGEQAADLVTGASEAIYGTPLAMTEQFHSKVSEVIYGTQEPLASSLLDRVNHVIEAASEKAGSVLHGTTAPLTERVASRASEAAFGSETPLSESLVHKVEEVYHNAKSKVNEFIHDSDEKVSEKSKSASSIASSLSSLASESSASFASSASSASSSASAFLKSISGTAATESVTFVDKAWEDYANAKGKAEEMVSGVREHLEL